jgi:O-antigen/teichoic acid export membrane protein
MGIDAPQKFARQYIAKLLANIMAIIAGLAMVVIVPRELGPANYGRYEFLLNFFQQVTGFLDAGTSACYYTRLSQSPGASRLVRLYGLFVLGVSAAMTGAVVCVFYFTPFAGRLWAGEAMQLVLLGGLLGCMTWWSQIVRKTFDAHDLTVVGEQVFMAYRLVTVAALLGLLHLVTLDLVTYFVFQAIILALALAVCVGVLAKSWPTANGAAAPAGLSLSNYVSDFVRYSSPLLASAVVVMVAGIVERWMLQTFGGSVEQGYYALAFQVGAVCFIFTSAMTQLLARELSRGWAAADIPGMARLFSRYVPNLYVLAAYFSMFVAFRAADIAALVGGQAFGPGAGVLAVMAFYPMHQTYGQLAGSVYLATGATRQYRNLGIVSSLFGLPAAYFLIAGSEFGGFGLGGEGLAMKVVVLQVLTVNVMILFSTRLLGLNFYALLRHQAIVPIVFAACAWCASTIAAILDLGIISNLLVSGSIYSVMALLAFLRLPGMQCRLREHEEGMR